MVDLSALAPVQQAFDRGLYLKAWAAAQPLGPLREWRGTEGRLLAGRLAMALGAGRLGVALHLRAFRADPEHPKALYYRARATLVSRGPYEAFRFMRQVDLDPGAAAEVRADWLALRGSVATRFRDFGAAERFVGEAEALCPGRPWVAVERATILEQQDRFEDALEVALRLLAADDGYRPGVQMAARLLERLGRFEEAVALLRKADGVLESASVAAHLAEILQDLQRPREMMEAIDRYETLSPLLEPGARSWVRAKRCDAFCELGDFEAARRHAAEVGTAFFKEVAKRLAEPEVATRPRRLLDVPFIQQEYLTCSPTALASVATFLDHPVDHGALGRKLAYDGTPGYRERQWAEEKGWVSREFRLSAEAACALIDNGVPFVLVTQEATSAHAQTIAGYDTRRGTLLIRDPAQPRLTEVLLDHLLEASAAHGPRCLALLPGDHAPQLAAVELPDEVAYDRQHQLELSLLRHDRQAAQDWRDTQDRETPGHRLVLMMDWRLALYDADAWQQRAACEGLLELSPGDPQLKLRQIELLLQLGFRAEAEAALEKQVRVPRSDPVFAVRLAELLSEDGRRLDEASRLLRRALRLRPADGATLTALASVLWSLGHREDALDHNHLAACAEIHNERFVRRYVTAALHLDRADEAVAFLRERVHDLGDRSSAPARSLFHGLEDLGRTSEALDSLEQALTRHPEDGALLLFAAEATGRYGRMQRARELVARSRGRARAVNRRRTEARLARWSGDLAGSLEAWRAVAEAEPLAEDAHAEIASLLADTDGPAAAREHLRRALARTPTHQGVHRLLVQWLGDSPEACREVLEEMLRRHPNDAWAHRELALVLADLGRLDEAAQSLERGAELQPDAASTHAVRGFVLRKAGHRAEAEVAFRAALEAAADYEAATDGLLDVLVGREAKADGLRFLGREILRQGVGDGLFAFQRRARGVLEARERLAYLQRARAERPDQWQAWSSLCDELREQDRLGEAAALLDDATQRFPLSATLWLDRARVARLQGRTGVERQALETAVAISPGWSLPLEHLAETLAREGRPDEALATLERALALDPGHAGLVTRRAELLLAAQRPVEAREAFERALFIDPSSGGAWNGLAQVTEADDRLAFARRLAEERRHDPEAVAALVLELSGRDAVDEQLGLLDRVLEERPRHVQAHDIRARILCEAGRHVAALEACSPPVFAGEPPLPLRGRRAWVLARSGRRAEAIQEMRAVLVSHPEYEWGARMLTEWTSESGSPREALEAADHSVRLEPASAVAFGYRGQARLRNGDVAGGCADLERALALDPGYPFGAARLFDTLLELSRVDEAEALLERLAPHLSEQERACRRVRVFCARGDALGAIQALGKELAARRPEDEDLGQALDAVAAAFGAGSLVRVVESSGGGIHPDAAAALVEALVGRGCRGEARQVLELFADHHDTRAAGCRAWLLASVEDPGDREVAEALVKLRPEDTEAVVLLARSLGSAPADSQLECWDRVLAHQPEHVEARDMRVVCLVELGRWKEARAACRALPGESELPVPLQARAAWIEAQAGKDALARHRMRAVVRRAPFARWAWDRLLEWDYATDREPGQYLEDARLHLEAFPGQPAAHGYLGDALERRGQPERAEEAYRRSLELDPGYDFGRLSLVDLLIRSRRLDEAQALVEVQNPSPALRIRAVQVALARGRPEDAGEIFVALLRDDSATPDQVEVARKSLVDSGQDTVLGSALERCVDSPVPCPPAVSLLMRWYVSRGDWRGADQRLEHLRRKPRLRREALAGYLRALRDKGNARRLRRFIRREEGALRADDELWGLAGHALSLVDEGAARRFMYDWASRRAAPFALNGLVVVLRHAGKTDEAIRVSRHALECPPDHVTGCHRVWLGVEAALAGEAEEAETLLKEVSFPDESGDFYQGLHKLARAVLVARTADGKPRGDAFREASRLLSEVDQSLGPRNEDYGPLRRRALFKLARAGGWRGWLWFLRAL